MKPKIGYVLIEHFTCDRPKVCEAPRHSELLYPLPAYAVIAVLSKDYPDGLVQMVCKDCWDHFDRDMDHSNWNIMEDKK